MRKTLVTTLAGLGACLAVSLPSAAEAQVWGTGTATAATASAPPTGTAGVDCDPEVLKMEEILRQQAVADRIQVARAHYTFMPDNGYSGTSCIDRLFGGLGGFSLGSIFNPPSLDDIISTIYQAACNTAMNYANAQVNQAIYATTINTGLPTGEVLPGVYMGSLTGGLNVAPGVSYGQISPGQFLRANIAGSWRGQGYSTGSMGGLFSR